MRFLCITLLLLLATSQMRAQSYPIYEPDRLALLEMERMGFMAGVTIPAQGVAILSNGLGGGIGVIRPAAAPQNEWRVSNIQRSFTRGTNPLPLSVDTLALAFTDSSFLYLNTLHLATNGLFGNFDNFANKTLPNLREITFASNNITNIDGLVQASTGRGWTTASFSSNNISSIPSALLEEFHSLREVGFDDNQITALPAPQFTCTVSLPGIGLNMNCPCYEGLDSLYYILLRNNQLGGTFFPEHFLGKQWQNKANSIVSSLTIESVRISGNNFRRVSPLALNAIFANPNADELGITNFLRQPRVADTTISPSCWAWGHLKLDNNFFDISDLHAFGVAFGVDTAVFSQIDTTVYCSPFSLRRYDYAPQRIDSLGIGGVRRRGTGASLEFDFEIEDWAFRFRDRQDMLNAWGIERYNYSWVWGNSTESPLEIAYRDATGTEEVSPMLIATSPTFSGLNNNQITLSLNNASTAERIGVRTIAHPLLDASYISYSVSTDKFDSIPRLYSRPKTIVFGECFDNDGNIIVCQEMTVQLNNSGRNEEREAAIRYLQDTLGARKTRDCMCGDVQLWALPDNVELTANGAGTRSAIPSTRNKPGLRSADANYPLNTGNSAATMAMPSVSPSQGTTDPTRTLVAIIDSGTDPDHPTLAQHIRRNTRETANDNIDNDGNCLINDILGYNFVDNNNIPYDDINHGTIVGSVAAGIGMPALAPTDASVALLPIKFTNRFGQGSTFEAACAIYYAVDYHRNRGSGVRDDDSVRVINASWGYRGEFSSVLNDAISYAGRRCGVLFVCAAGNDGTDMDSDSVGNYPAHFSLPNILVVSAADGANLAPYSNYGATSAHIAARGTYTNVAIPQQGASPNTTPLPQSGTSFATPYVSRAAAILFNRYPQASAEAVKQALIATATPLTSADSSKLVSGGMVNLQGAIAYLDSMSAVAFCTTTIGVNEPAINEEQATSDYILFPNPARENLQIAFTQPYTEATIVLFDAKGSEISRTQARGESHVQVSLAQLPQGLYLVQIRNGAQTQTHKVLKVN